MDPIFEKKLMGLDLEAVILNKYSHEVSVYISGYIAKKLIPRAADCCACKYIYMIVGENKNIEYQMWLDYFLYNELSDYVISYFVIFD